MVRKPKFLEYTIDRNGNLIDPNHQKYVDSASKSEQATAIGRGHAIGDGREGTSSTLTGTKKRKTEAGQSTSEGKTTQFNLNEASDTRKSSQPNLPTTMESSSTESSTLMRSSAMSTQGGSQYAQQTTMPMYHNPTMGFGETHTIICPLDIYFSYNDLGVNPTGTINKMEIRMNSPYTPVLAPSALQPQTAGGLITEGFATNVAPDNINNPAVLEPFPIPFTVGAGPAYNIIQPKPAWLGVYEKIYDVYAVLETKWSLTAQLNRTNKTTGGLVVWEYDTYGASATGNVMPDTVRQRDLVAWPNVKTAIVKPLDTGSGTPVTKIGETWNHNKVKTNVFNEEDNKTWTATGAVPSPQYVESLHLRFFKAPLAEGGSNQVASSMNCHLRVSYLVQFKDKKLQFRYPSTGQPDIPLNFPSDVLQTTF